MNYIKKTNDNWCVYLSQAFLNIGHGHCKNNENPFKSIMSNISKITSSKDATVHKGNIDIGGNRKIEVFLKEYHYRSFSDKIKHLIRKNRASRSVIAAELLSLHGFCAPRTIAYGWKKSLSFINERPFTLTESVADSKNIYEIFEKFNNKSSFVNTKKKREFIRNFGREIGKLHATGFSHGDLRCGNILVQENNDRWLFHYIDNERTKCFKRLPMKLRIKNLVQINMLCSSAISRTDRLRFFKEYIKETRLINEEEIISIVQDTTHRRLTKLINQGRINKNDITI